MSKDRPGYWVYYRRVWYPIISRWARQLQAQDYPIVYSTRAALVARGAK